MTPNEYQQLAMQTNGMTNFQDMLLGATLGMSGETGEIADSIKKYFFHGHELNNPELRKELGDVLWYVALMCETCGFQLEDIMEENIAKLKRRYPQGFSNERSINREEYRKGA